MLILGIETSCDDTAVGVVSDGRNVLTNVVASQVEIHARYGGIVPEVASRQHLLSLLPITQRALAEAGATLNDVDAVAVTHGPGLAGSLLVGVNFAKGQSLGSGLPLIGVNHLEAPCLRGLAPRVRSFGDAGVPLHVPDRVGRPHRPCPHGKGTVSIAY